MTKPDAYRCEHCRGPMPLPVRSHARLCSSKCRQAAWRARRRDACTQCAGPMPTVHRSDRKYCSRACEAKAYRGRLTTDRLPAELTSRTRWVRRSAQKVPLTVDGRAASSTNPATWSSYMEADKSTAGVGLGFVLDGDGIVCVDLDHCLDRGRLAPWAARILAAMPNTYVEVSPGGDGLHIWGLGDIARGRRVPVAGGGMLEIYGTARYLTVTGKRFGKCPRSLAPLPESILKLAAG